MLYVLSSIIRAMELYHSRVSTVVENRCHLTLTIGTLARSCGVLEVCDLRNPASLFRDIGPSERQTGAQATDE